MTQLFLRPRWSRLAFLALAFGLLAPFTFGISTPPALLFGWLSLRQIGYADGALRGRRVAIAGFVLGVIGIVIFGIGIVLVSLTQVRALSADTVCKNNLRRIGLAVNVYHDEHAHFPPGTMPGEGLPPERRLSWQAAILPFMDPGRSTQPVDVYVRLDIGRGWDVEPNRDVARVRMPEFLCPGQKVVANVGDAAPTMYLGIAGVGLDAATLHRDHARAGFFGYDRFIDRQDVTRGQAETLLAAESATRLGPWISGGGATVRPVVPDDQPYIGVGRPFGGLHSGGTLTVFVDGHVQVIANGINPRIWEAHATLRD